MFWVFSERLSMDLRATRETFGSLVRRHRHFIRHTTLVCSVVLPVYWLMVTIGKDGDGTFGLVGL